MYGAALLRVRGQHLTELYRMQTQNMQNQTRYTQLRRPRVNGTGARRVHRHANALRSAHRRPKKQTLFQSE